MTYTDKHRRFLFQCRMVRNGIDQTWDGRIRSICNYGSHQEIAISSRSGLTLIVGAYSHGNFLSVPDYGVGCGLAHYSDAFWNQEQLSRLLPDIDAVTIAEALRFLDKHGLLGCA